MKKQMIMYKNTLTLVLGLIIMIALSCEKEKKLQTFGTKGENSTALRLTPDELIRHTNSFITQSLQGEWNPGNYKFQDAVLILEGALNYRTCTPHEYYDEITTDSTLFELPIYQDTDNNWYVNAEQTVELWNQLLEHARAVRERLRNDNYFNIVADLEIVETDYQIEVITISAVVWAGLATLIPIQGCEFDQDDDWTAMPWVSPNYCGTNTNTNSSSIKELQRRLTLLCQPACNGNYYMYVTDGLWLYGGFYQTLAVCPGEKIIWWGTNSSDCLNEYQMQCNLDGILYLTGYTAPMDPSSPSSNLPSIAHRVIWDSGATYAIASKPIYGKCATYNPD